jgi:regulator of RNase E activity RraA
LLPCRIETVEINGPIGIQGIRVDPGDLVVADDSGVSVIPLEVVEQVLEQAQKMAKIVAGYEALLAQGADRETLKKELGVGMSSLMRTAVKSVSSPA